MSTKPGKGKEKVAPRPKKKGAAKATKERGGT